MFLWRVPHNVFRDCLHHLHHVVLHRMLSPSHAAHRPSHSFSQLGTYLLGALHVVGCCGSSCCGAKDRAVNTCCLCLVLPLPCSPVSALAPVLALQFMLSVHAPVLCSSAHNQVHAQCSSAYAFQYSCSHAHDPVLTLQCRRKTRAKRKTESIS